MTHKSTNDLLRQYASNKAFTTPTLSYSVLPQHHVEESKSFKSRFDDVGDVVSQQNQRGTRRFMSDKNDPQNPGSGQPRKWTF